jgi:anti-sigma B factor antagonist
MSIFLLPKRLYLTERKRNAAGRSETMLNLSIHNLGDTAVFRCAGRITFGDGDALQTAISRQQPIRVAVLDLAEISTIDAAGLGSLLSARKWAGATGTELKLMNLTPQVEELLDLTRLRSVFAVYRVQEMLDLLCRAVRQSRFEEVPATVESTEQLLTA